MARVILGKGFGVAALAALLTAGATLPASAQFAEVGSLIRQFLLLPEEPKEPIDYRERAPLVVPPDTTRLRPPGEPRADQRANWPRDPDVEARQQARQRARTPAASPDMFTRDGGTAPALSPEMAAQGRAPGARGVLGPGATPTDSMFAGHNPGNVYGGAIALQMMNQQAREQLDDGNYVEPRRRFLTDPPTGLRAAAGNAPVRASREGSLGVRRDVSPYDLIEDEQRNRGR